MMKKISLLLGLIVVTMACQSPKEKKVENNAAEFHETVSEVDTIVLRRTPFDKQIVCNGKLKALLKSNLNFKNTGKLIYIGVQNGTSVAKGTRIASQEKQDAQMEVTKAKRNLDKAILELKDKLIGQGYNTDTVHVPKPILKSAKDAVGYDNAMEALFTARQKLKETDLTAPFSGKIANLESKIHDLTTDKFCTLIDDSKFDVEFSVLEAELAEIKKGDRVKVSPFIAPDDMFEGVVTEINPVIDEKGQINIRARIDNRKGKLIEGMNVKIILQKRVENQFVVPKDAVLIRDGYYIVFKLEDGVAVWTYVDVVASNIDSHVITGNAKKQTEISENDVIITSGNLNLADGVKVKPRK